MIIDSKIQSVTVYKDRALVDRAAQINLESGEHKLIFNSLPTGIDPNSLQVNGSKNAILLDIKLKDVYLTEITDDEKKIIVKEIEEIESEILELNDKLNNTNLERTFLQNLASVSGESSKKSVIALFLPDKVNEMLKFYNEKLNHLDDSKRTYLKEIKNLDNRLNFLKQQNSQFNQKQLKSEKQVELKINITKGGPVNIIIMYLVMNASWTPVYDLRLDSEEKKLKLAYNAIVRQSTGEKWDNVILKLSTARPHISAIRPTISPWFIDVFKYPDAPAMSGSMMFDEEESVDRSMMKKSKGMAVMKAAPMQIPVTKVEAGATSVIFSIPIPSNISDNNEEHKIGITNLEFNAKLEYNATPKVSPFAYLNSTTTNNSEYPLLAGKSNVFLDNNFVANSILKLIAPNEEFSTSLGIDEGIKVEHKLVNKFTKEEGIFSKKSKIVYESLIEIKNNKKIESLIKIKDQIPISQNQEIKVELIEPRYKEDSDFLKKGLDGILEWTQILKPEENIKIGLKFSVEFPKDISLTGLE
jgi:uncharacterized protein (TIGR02231 family)